MSEQCLNHVMTMLCLFLISFNHMAENFNAKLLACFKGENYRSFDCGKKLIHSLDSSILTFAIISKS